MVFFKRPSTKNWLIIYIVFPLTPFVIGSFIRLITLSGNIDWNTFSASDLSICLALAAILINQSLLRTARVLDDADKREEVAVVATLYLILGFIFITIFSLTVAFNLCVTNLTIEKLSNPLHVFQISAWVLMPIIVWYSIRIQKSFKLKTSIL